MIEISLSSLVAGTKYRGEFEERLDAVVKEASANPKPILFTDEIHLLLVAGSASGSMDAANILKPALARGAIRVIGATTTKEYRQTIEKGGALERRFQMLRVEEPSADEAVAILLALRPRLEAHHGVALEEAALRAAVEWSVRYLPDFRLPDKALDLVKEGFSEQYGARNLEQTMDRLLGPLVSEAVLSGKISTGQRIQLDVIDGRIQFSQVTAS